jgi:type I restriction enzyme S subunit
MMAASYRVQSGALGSRLDSTFYTPALVENEERLSHCSFGTRPLSELVSNGRRVIYVGTTTAEKDVAPSNWIPWVTSDDLAAMGFFLSTDTVLRVSPDFAARYERGKLRDSELLVKVKGPDQLAAYIGAVPEGRTVLVSGTLWGGVVRTAEVDPWYLTAVLEAPYGRIARTRRRTNLNVEFVSPDDLVEVPIPMPSDGTQTYIGKKVRQAEMLLIRARNLEDQIASALARHIGITLPANGTRYGRAQLGDLTHRLDAKYYSAGARHVRAALASKSTAIAVLKPDVSNGFEHREFVEVGRPYLTVGDVASGRIVVTTAPRIAWDVNIPAKARIDENCVLIVRTGSIGTAVQPLSEDCDVAISSHFIRLRFASKGIAAAVAAFMSSEAGRVLQQASSYGALQPQVSQDEILEIPIPNELLEMGEQLFDLRRSSDEALRHAARLTFAARLLVEALIDCKVVEAELIAAHKDPAADRALLERLMTDGFDATTGDRLFRDLDRLDELLAKAKPRKDA